MMEMNVDNKLHTMNLLKKYFECIRDGSKSVELRCNDDKRKCINIGDNIVFSCDSNAITKNISNILHFKTFKDAISFFGVSRVMPLETENSAVEIYNSLYGDKEAIYGVVAFVL